MTEENYPSKNLLESLPPAQLADLSSILEPRSFPTGTRLMEEGETGDGCYFIDSGKVRVELEKNRENGPLLLGYIHPGGVVGEMNLMGMPTRSASVYAETDATMRWLSLEKFTSLKNSNPELHGSLVSIFSEDITRKVRSTEKSLSEQNNSADTSNKSDANPTDSISESERQFIANGRYALDRLLGKGGAGAVYLAYDTKLDRWVAIKRLPSSESTISGEAKLMASFQHPNIVTMHDILQEGDETIFVMELVLGQTLEDLAEPLTEDTFRNLAAQCLEGLSAAHNKNIVHRDIKPSNIMLEVLQDGRYCVKILDFGQSRTMEAPSLQTMDHSGAVIGSIYMMSPEQLSHEALDARTDLSSLGCVFYQALTLQRPFSGSSFPEVIAAHLQHQFKPLRDLRPDLPKSLTDWVEKLFSLDRQDRPANSQTALEDLKSTTAPEKVHIISSDTKNIAVVPAPVLKPVSVVQIPVVPIAVAAIPTPIATPVPIQPVTVSVSKPLSTQQNLFLPRSPQPQPVEPSFWNSTPQPTSKISLAKVGIAIGAAVVLLAAGAYVGFTIFGSKLPSGFEPLVKPGLSNILMTPKAWSLDGDTLEYSGKGGDCWTKERYGNFEMNFEVQLPKGGNSGVFFRSKNPQANILDSFTLELDIIDGKDAGTLVMQEEKPKQPLNIADGNWHRFSILAEDNSITVSYNGKEFYSWKLTDPKISKEGHIGFQGGREAVKYRNIAIKKL
ncbi:MAG: hypothetical protein RL630_401 [Verrucomicrobiota bacterium]|jgi:serine/threonine protein kinase